MVRNPRGAGGDAGRAAHELAGLDDEHPRAVVGRGESTHEPRAAGTDDDDVHLLGQALLGHGPDGTAVLGFDGYHVPPPSVFFRPARRCSGSYRHDPTVFVHERVAPVPHPCPVRLGGPPEKAKRAPSARERRSMAPRASLFQATARACAPHLARGPHVAPGTLVPASTGIRSAVAATSGRAPHDELTRAIGGAGGAPSRSARRQSTTGPRPRDRPAATETG